MLIMSHTLYYLFSDYAVIVCLPVIALERARDEQLPSPTIRYSLDGFPKGLTISERFLCLTISGKSKAEHQEA